MPAKRKTVATPLVRKASFSHGIKLAGAKRSISPELETSSKRRKLTSANPGSPYAAFARPTASEVERLHKVLARHFGERRQAKRSNRQILDTVVGTILSQNTTNTNSHRAFAQLTDAFPTWDAVRKARPSAVQKTIKCGGLAPKKTVWIQNILKTLYKEQGKTSAQYLMKASKEKVHTDLERFTGVGKKTSAIVNMFTVGHPDMAVDTHVFRYALQLGWAPSDRERAAYNKKAKKLGVKPWPVVSRDTIYNHLDARFPDKLKYSMHLILTDTEGGLPVVCGAGKKLSFDGKKVMIDGKPCVGV